MLLPVLGYGADFNPEQWDDVVLEDDVALMVEAGVTVVTVGVFAWALLEPEQDVFRLEWLRRVLDRLHAAGIGVDLATGTASPPPWLGARYPSTLPITADGTTLWWGSRQQYNPSSAVFRDRLRALVERMATEFAHHPAVVAWHVGNEYACEVRESFDDESVQRFREWLTERYGSLDALNAAWGTSFWSQRVTSWDQVVGPRPTPTDMNPHVLTDWNAFWSTNLLDLFLLEKAILRAANPAIPVTTNFMSLFEHLDYWAWAEHVDFVSNDSYPDPANPRAAREFAFDADLMRSLGGGRPWVQMEQVTSAVQWRARNAPKRPGQYELWSLGAVARGADGILNFQWRQSVAGSETFHGAMVQHAGTESRVWGEVTAARAVAGRARAGARYPRPDADRDRVGLAQLLDAAQRRGARGRASPRERCQGVACEPVRARARRGPRAPRERPDGLPRRGGAVLVPRHAASGHPAAGGGPGRVPGRGHLPVGVGGRRRSCGARWVPVDAW